MKLVKPFVGTRSITSGARGHKVTGYVIFGGTERAPMTDYRNIITTEPGERSGKPCIRGMRITVYDILAYFAGEMTVDNVLKSFPELTHEDIKI
jgi:uncharacterized protein (DUF433 family)